MANRAPFRGKTQFNMWMDCMKKNVFEVRCALPEWSVGYVSVSISVSNCVDALHCGRARGFSVSRPDVNCPEADVSGTWRRTRRYPRASSMRGRSMRSSWKLTFHQTW